MGDDEDVRELIDRAVYGERERIARDLHDLVIQRLFAIGLGIQLLNRPPDEQLTGFVAEIDQAIRDIRTSIFFLRQRPNTTPSLRAEILRVISDTGASLGYEPTVRLEGPLDSVVPADVHLDLIATLREALSNVVRHALAGKVWVTVTVDQKGSRIDLLVKDNGCGLPAVLSRRSGLANIEQRALRLRGHCRVYAPKEGGTRVYWTVPLNRTVRWMDTGAEPVEATP